MLLIGALAFLAIIVLFTLAARYGTRHAGRVLGARIRRIHEDTEYILDHEAAPPRWLADESSDSSQTSAKRRRRRRVFRRLRRLERYLQRTPAFDSVESREYVLGEIRRIRGDWEHRSVAEIGTSQAADDAEQSEQGS